MVRSLYLIAAFLTVLPRATGQGDRLRYRPHRRRRSSDDKSGKSSKSKSKSKSSKKWTVAEAAAPAASLRPPSPASAKASKAAKASQGSTSSAGSSATHGTVSSGKAKAAKDPFANSVQDANTAKAFKSHKSSKGYVTSIAQPDYGVVIITNQPTAKPANGPSNESTQTTNDGRGEDELPPHCQSLLRQADVDSNDLLNSSEYTAFLNTLKETLLLRGGGAPPISAAAADRYPDLPSRLKMNFVHLSCMCIRGDCCAEESGIYVGAQTAATLEAICEHTVGVIVAELEDGSPFSADSPLAHAPSAHVMKPPSRAPLSSAPTPAPTRMNVGVIVAAPEDGSTPSSADSLSANASNPPSHAPMSPTLATRPNMGVSSVQNCTGEPCPVNTWCRSRDGTCGPRNSTFDTEQEPLGNSSASQPVESPTMATPTSSTTNKPIINPLVSQSIESPTVPGMPAPPGPAAKPATEPTAIELLPSNESFYFESEGAPEDPPETIAAGTGAEGGASLNPRTAGLATAGSLVVLLVIGMCVTSRRQQQLESDDPRNTEAGALLSPGDEGTLGSRRGSLRAPAGAAARPACAPDAGVRYARCNYVEGRTGGEGGVADSLSHSQRTHGARGSRQGSLRAPAGAAGAVARPASAPDAGVRYASCNHVDGRTGVEGGVADSLSHSQRTPRARGSRQGSLRAPAGAVARKASAPDAGVRRASRNYAEGRNRSRRRPGPTQP